MTTTEDRPEPEREKEGQFPSPCCHCHWQEPYGFVPEDGCRHHDTAQFQEFVRATYSKGVHAGIALARKSR